MRFIIALALAVAGFIGGAQAQSRLDFNLVNRTGYQIDEVYISASNSNDWGDDVMGSDVLENSKRVAIQFNRRAASCNWDMKVVYNDGDKSEWRGLNLCSISTVTLFWNRQTQQTRAVTE